MSHSRREEMSSLEQVLAVENSRKHKIERLLIVSTSSRDGALRPEHEVQVDFGAVRYSPSSGGGNTTVKVIAVSVRSDLSGWASRTLSEVEEQIERTKLHYSSPMLALVGLVVFMFLVLVFQLVKIEPQKEDISNAMWLDSPSLDRVEKILSQGRTLTDDEMREITTLQLRNVLLDQRPKQPPPKGRARKAVLLGIPFLLVLGLTITLIKSCYPGAVFLWGDEVDRYSNIIQRRKVIWGVILSLVVVGVLSKLLFEGLSSWIPTD